MESWRNFLFSYIIVVVIFVVSGQKNGFQLPNLSRDAPKPQVPQDLASYFQLPDAGARKFVGSYLPGFIPPASFDIADPVQQQQSLLQSGGQPFGVLTASNGLNGLNSGLSSSGLSGLGSGLSSSGLSGLGSGLSSSGLSGLSNSLASSGLSGLSNGLNALLSSNSGFGQQSNPSSSIAQSPNNAFPFLPQFPAGFNSGFSVKQNNRADGNETDSKNSSSISGIPNVFPSLPRAPIPQASNVLPSLPIRPEVPQGGLGPLAGNLPFLNQGASQQSSLGSLNILQRLAGQQSVPVAPGSPFLPNSGLQGSGLQQGSGFLGSGLQGGALPQSSLGGSFPNAAALYPQQAPGNENLLAQLLRSVGLNGVGSNLDLSSVNQLLGFTPQQSPQGGNGLLSNVIYNALTDNNVQTQDANGTNIIDSKANAALIQNLLTQPSSPFCNPKPLPVDKFDVDSFTGKWYQVLYSPPLSAGPCSMITYQKLADVGQGGPGTVFDTFEYTTEATPYGKPRISSGYGIVRGPGQLIYRTTNSPTDVNVYVLQTGPMNTDGQYEYIVLAVNCNYPLHVFARDPVVYKQKYESEVNSLLEKRGLVTSWSRLLNMVAPVDYNLCTFPPSLFNVRG